jgi:hypothetical protein
MKFESTVLGPASGTCRTDPCPAQHTCFWVKSRRRCVTTLKARQIDGSVLSKAIIQKVRA